MHIGASDIGTRSTVWVRRSKFKVTIPGNGSQKSLAVRCLALSDKF